MPHQFLLHSHRCSRVIQPGTIGVPERVPAYTGILSSGVPPLIVDQHPLAIRCRRILHTPDANPCPAL